MQEWLSAVLPLVGYLAVFLVTGGEFVCLPLPGGVVLTTAALPAVRGSVEPWVICVAAVAGVLAGSAVGYRLGRGGRAVLDRIVRRSPRVLSAARLAATERLFERWVCRRFSVASTDRMISSAVTPSIDAGMSNTSLAPSRPRR